MYTIKQASRLTGVPSATLRAWERRYAVVRPARNDAGYRVYDEGAIAAILSLRRLIDAGWSPAEAARAIRDGGVDPTTPPGVEPGTGPGTGPATGRGTGPGTGWGREESHEPAELLRDFLDAAARLDSLGLEECLDRAFLAGSFELVAERWLFPALSALGEEWAGGRIDVAGEHLASQAVRRRLARAFDAAGSRLRGPAVVVGLPAGSRHELGALTFAVVARRRGLDVHYLGEDLPTASWVAAVAGRHVDAVVLSVVMAEDRAPALGAARALRAEHPDLLLAAGGPHAAHLEADVRVLPASVSRAAAELDDLLHGTGA